MVIRRSPLLWVRRWAAVVLPVLSKWRQWAEWAWRPEEPLEGRRRRRWVVAVPMWLPRLWALLFAWAAA